MLLVMTLHGVAIHDGLHVLLMVDPAANHLGPVFALLFINLLLYIVCCHSDPGELGAGGQLLQHSLDRYQYDGVLYRHGVVCSTCNIVKPARSKHCREYNYCTQVDDS